MSLVYGVFQFVYYLFIAMYLDFAILSLFVSSYRFSVHYSFVVSLVCLFDMPGYLPILSSLI